VRLQISLPPETWEAVKEMARAARRPPRQQIEYLVIRAVKGKYSENTSREPVTAGAGHE
jgi:hypothetical protein